MAAAAAAAEQQEESFADMEKAFNAQYEATEKQMLGEGTYGQVYKARHRSTGNIVALKKMKIDSEEEGVPSTALREVALLRALDHENVVRLFDVCCSPSKLILVFEFLENDLKKYMKAQGRSGLNDRTVRSFTFQLCKGLEYCHANRVIHRDLKPHNLLIDSHNRLKIADFGLARTFSLPVPKYTHEVITVWYRPPEILLGSQLYSLPVDMWSTGCILAEMATGQALFCGDSEIDTIFKIFQKLGTPTEEEWPGVSELPDFKPTFPKWKHKGWENIRNMKTIIGTDGIDLLQQFLAYDPASRLSARRALQMPYIVDVTAGA